MRVRRRRREAKRGTATPLTPQRGRPSATAGVMVVPQALAYAKLAGLPPEYGLYASFGGVLSYW